MSPTRDHHSSRRSRRSRSRSQEKNRNSDKKDSKKSEMEDKKRRSDRGNGGDKDEKYLKDPMEDKKLDVSSVAHKRSSSASEDEMLNSNSKRSKHDAALECHERKDEDHIEEDRRDLDSVGSKSEKRSLGNGDHEKQNHDTNRKTDKSHDRDDSSRKDRKYREDESRHSRDRRSRHSSSRSHRSSRHSREKYHGDTTDQHKSKKSEEGSKSRKDDCLLDDTLSSDRRKVQSEDSPRRKHNQLAASSDVHGINHDTGVKVPNDFSEADQGIQEAKQVVHETDMSSAPCLEDPFLAQDKQDKPIVAGLNGRHEPGVDGAFVGTEESAI